MKIYYSIDEITDNCYNPCPVLNKDKNIIGIHIGSCKCKECKYCYGASNKRYPSPMGVGDKDGKLTIRYDLWIKCSGIYEKPTLSIKIQKLFYNIKRKILNLFNKKY
jgi:hypothetical protein